LCSQPTLSRLENALGLREAILLSYALVDLWMDSYEGAPSTVTLDIDDTVARTAFDTAVSLWPGAAIELRQKARVIASSG
jgi:hypothetical protein